jgi:hypothetical protein
LNVEVELKAKIKQTGEVKLRQKTSEVRMRAIEAEKTDFKRPVRPFKSRIASVSKGIVDWSQQRWRMGMAG